jgi:hypothetical protein
VWVTETEGDIHVCTEIVLVGSLLKRLPQCPDWKSCTYCAAKAYLTCPLLFINDLFRVIIPPPIPVTVLPLDCWDHRFESRWGHERSSLVFFVCCVGSGLCDVLTFRGFLPCVCVCVCLIVCDLENSTMRRPRPELGCCATEKHCYPPNLRSSTLISLFVSHPFHSCCMPRLSHTSWFGHPNKV